jgi:hypothetical protein
MLINVEDPRHWTYSRNFEEKKNPNMVIGIFFLNFHVEILNVLKH